MPITEIHADTDPGAYEQSLARDTRVQREFDQLNRLLEEIDHFEPTGADDVSDANWHVNDFEVSRWRIVVKGNTRLDRIAHFRSELQRRDDIIDARVERFDGGEIAIRLVTTGGIPMGPLEKAVWALTREDPRITQTG